MFYLVCRTYVEIYGVYYYIKVNNKSSENVEKFSVV
jgi:hypothetical protein